MCGPMEPRRLCRSTLDSGRHLPVEVLDSTRLEQFAHLRMKAGGELYAAVKDAFGSVAGRAAVPA
jgi:hypothetical protein